VRTPSTPAERWAWWEAAVAGEAPPVHEAEPQTGFFAVRRFRYGDWRQGPFVPARVWWEPGEIDPETGELLSDERCRAEIDGKPADPWSKWTWIARRPISESEWKWLKAQAPLLPKTIPPKSAR
jgi:hypothetical protein